MEKLELEEYTNKVARKNAKKDVKQNFDFLRISQILKRYPIKRNGPAGI